MVLGIAWTLLVLGMTSALWWLGRYLRDGRRVGSLVLGALGSLVALVAAGLLGLEQGHPGLLAGTGITAVVIFVAGNVLGYPVLTVFLLWSGITVLRRESRSLGNALALLAGIGLVLLPTTVRWLEPADAVQDDPGYMIRYGLHLAVTLFVGYFGFCFSVFLVASLLYRWRPVKLDPEAVIVLGSGLIEGKVPPLLVQRLHRGLEAHRRYGSKVLITSGGQGHDEPVPEGEAMRDYLIAEGAKADQIIAETKSRNTAENLEHSQALLDDPESPVIVVTSSYHAFRAALLTRQRGMRAHVIGSKTAWYFLPSAVIREFMGVLRDQLKLHLVAGVSIVGFTGVISAVLVPAMATP